MIIGKVLAVRRRCKRNIQPHIPFDTVEMLIQAGTVVHDTVSIAPVQTVSTILVSILKTIQTLRQNRADCKDLEQSLIDIHNKITDILKGYSDLSSPFLNSCNRFLQSLLELSSSINNLARIGPFWAFIKSTTIKNEIERHKQKLLEWKQDFTMTTVIDFRLYVEQRLPRQLGYTWEHGQRLHLIDAMDMKLDLPIELCDTWNDFNELIKFIFRRRHGKRYVERDDYDLTDQQQREVLNSSNWHARARFKITMDIVLRSIMTSRDDSLRPCPACKHLCNIDSLADETKCPACLCTFRMSEVPNRDYSLRPCPACKHLCSIHFLADETQCPACLCTFRTSEISSPDKLGPPLPRILRKHTEVDRRTKIKQQSEVTHNLADTGVSSNQQLLLTVGPGNVTGPDNTAEPDDIRYFRRIHVKITMTPRELFKKKALLIGISYDKRGGLRGPQKDVRAMEQLLLEHYGYKHNDIDVLTDEENAPIQPTHKNIVDRIKLLIHDAKPGDRFFFHYVGHTDQVKNRNHTEEDSMDECIVPIDSVKILDNDLRRYLVEPLPVGCHLVAIFDSCHSESLLDLSHYKCNRVYVPWISKGRQHTDSLQNRIVRRNGVMLDDEPHGTVRTVYQSKRMSSSSLASEKTSMLVLSPESPVSSKSPATPKSPKSRSLSVLTHVWDEFGKSPIDIDMPVCESPTAMFPCDGFCGLRPNPKASNKANVVSSRLRLRLLPMLQISLASCKDSQWAWEIATGESMTQALIKILSMPLILPYISDLTFAENDPHPTLRDLMIDISHAVHEQTRKLHAEGVEYKEKFKKWRAQHGNANIAECSVDTDNFPNPQLASHYPLNMSDTFDM